MSTIFIKQQGQGEPIILLHGWGFSGEVWNDIAQQLAQNWRVYQVDLPGHGHSSLCAYTLPILTEQLAANLPKNAVWIGWSLGGLLAMAMARWRPAWVRALVLISTSPRFITDKDWPHAIKLSVLQQFSKLLQTHRLVTLQRFLALQVKGSDNALQQRRTLNAFLENTTLPHPEALRAGLALLQNTDLRPELSQIYCPALLCLGKRDTIVPASVGADCQQYWPNLQPIYIEQAAHVPFLSHPNIFMHSLQGFFNEVITP